MFKIKFKIRYLFLIILLLLLIFIFVILNTKPENNFSNKNFKNISTQGQATFNKRPEFELKEYYSEWGFESEKEFEKYLYNLEPFNYSTNVSDKEHQLLVEEFQNMVNNGEKVGFINDGNVLNINILGIRRKEANTFSIIIEITPTSGSVSNGYQSINFIKVDENNFKYKDYDHWFGWL